MSSIHRKVVSEILLDPTVVLPLVAGGSAWLISWAVGGVRSLMAAGLVSILAGVGWLATRFIFQVEPIAQRLLVEEREAAARAEEERLDGLYASLLTDDDPRPEGYLVRLRSTKQEFEAVVRQPGVEGRSLVMVGQVRQLFHAAVEQIARSQRLWDESRRMSGQDRQSLVEERETVLEEVQQSVDHLQATTQHFRRLMLKEATSDLSQLREELEMSLRVAKRTEERMREFDHQSTYRKETPE